MVPFRGRFCYHCRQRRKASRDGHWRRLRCDDDVMASRPPHRCPGPISRRTWLRLGGLSCGALFSGLAPSLSRLLAAEAKESPGATAERDFSVILFWANGGPSHLETFDLKPDAPVEYRGPLRPIRT